MGAYTNVALALALTGLTLSACQSGLSLTDNQKRGKQIYEGLCDKCHGLINPTHLSDQAWTAAANKYGGQLKLSREDIQSVIDYLTHANDDNKKG